MSNCFFFLQYCRASSTLSVGGIRQQFSLEENVQMSLFGAEFLRNINEHLGVAGEEPIDVQFHPYGYLYLANNDDAAALEQNHRMQTELGAKNILLSPESLKQRFPWLSTDGVALGCLGLKNEGWFDPWALLTAFKRKGINMGAKFINAEFVDVMFSINPYAAEDRPLAKLRPRKVIVSALLLE